MGFVLLPGQKKTGLYWQRADERVWAGRSEDRWPAYQFYYTMQY